MRSPKAKSLGNGLRLKAKRSDNIGISVPHQAREPL
jgi:hypothetical protein